MKRKCTALTWCVISVTLGGLSTLALHTGAARPAVASTHAVPGIVPGAAKPATRPKPPKAPVLRRVKAPRLALPPNRGTSAPQSTTQRALGTAPVPFGPTSAFRTRVDRAPLDPNSAAIVAHLNRQVVNNWNGVAAFNAYYYNASFYRVPAGQPRIDVGYHNCQKKKSFPRGLHDGSSHFKSVPVPPHAVPAKASDSSMTIYDPATDQLWEFWKMRKNAKSGRWEACWGGRIDNVSKSEGIFERPYGAIATGMAMAGGMISVDEVRRGRIDHTMYLAVIHSQRYPRVSWPANRGDGNSSSPNAVKQGQRLRLDPNLDLSKYKLSPVGLMVAKAAQTYGFVVSDTSGAVAVITESGQREQAITGVDPWKKILNQSSYDVLRNFPWDKLQAIAVDYGKPSAVDRSGRDASLANSPAQMNDLP